MAHTEASHCDSVLVYLLHPFNVKQAVLLLRRVTPGLSLLLRPQTSGFFLSICICLARSVSELISGRHPTFAMALGSTTAGQDGHLQQLSGS
jgi:hypothetical protein